MLKKTVVGVCILACLTGITLGTEITVRPQLNQHERELLELTNIQRQQHGLPALMADAWLQGSARNHTAWMTRYDVLQHTNQAVGENIAMGQRSSHEAVADWMNSPGHRANMLNGQFTRIGVAAYTAQNGACYWCLQFLP